jgi:hypothetical protein
MELANTLQSQFLQQQISAPSLLAIQTMEFTAILKIATITTHAQPTLATPPQETAPMLV